MPGFLIIINMEGLEETKTQRRNRRRKEKRASERVYLLCSIAGHNVGTMSASKVSKRYGVEASPGDRIRVDVTQCNDCDAAEEEKRLAGVREIGRINHLFRPEQHTRVVVHRVVFRCVPPNRKTACNAITSFQGSVIDVETSVNDETGVPSAIVTVMIRPRNGMVFSQCSPPDGAVPYGLPMTHENFEDRRVCCVKLNISHLNRDSPFIVLGQRCRQDRCKEECKRHTLGAIRVVVLPPPAVAAPITIAQRPTTED